MELLNSIGLSIVAFAFVLGVMILVHELGHHLVAKFLGIRVEVFSLGFGEKTIWSFFFFPFCIFQIGSFCGNGVFFPSFLLVYLFYSLPYKPLLR